MNGHYPYPSSDVHHSQMQAQAYSYPYSHHPPHPQYVHPPPIWGAGPLPLPAPYSIAYAPPHAPILAHRPPTYHHAPPPPPAVGYYPYLSSLPPPPPPPPAQSYFAPGPVLAPIQSQPQSRYAFASSTAGGGGGGYGPVGHGSSRESSVEREVRSREASMQDVTWSEQSGRGGGGGAVQGKTIEYHDHPSFDRPPHRSDSSIRSNSTSRDPPPAVMLATTTSGTDPTTVSYDLIPPNVSAVPPPPPIEKSAVPLADLATEMVWEAVALAISSSSTSGSMSAGREVKGDELMRGRESRDRSLSSSGGRDEPRTPEPLFGAIGEKRTTTTTAGRSNWSSPSTSMPGTPSASQSIGTGFGQGYGTGYDWRGRTKSKQGGEEEVELCGLGFGEFGGEDEQVRISRRMEDSPIPDQHQHPLRPSHSLVRHQLRRQQSSSSSLQSHSHSRASSTSTSTSVPTIAFRQFVKQVLTATLIAPEDLILALYYVARIPTASIIQPAPVDQRLSLSARANAVKAAPFKIFLGALMLANKSLQDNSYRNETFSTVSGIPLKDVNDLEIFVYASLDFNTTVQSSLWSTWLSVVGERVRAHKGGDVGDRGEVERSLMGLKKALRNFVEEEEVGGAEWERERERENGVEEEEWRSGDVMTGLSTPPTTPERKSGPGSSSRDSCAIGWNGQYSTSTSTSAQSYSAPAQATHYPYQQHQPQQYLPQHYPHLHHHHHQFDSPVHSRSIWMNYPVSQTRVVV